MRIQNNMMAINTHRQLAVNQLGQQKSTEKLSSGFRINRAADDAAGLSISEKMRAQIRGLQRASMNAQDGISMIQAAEGALTESHSILQRIRELAVQGASDVNADQDRSAIMNEIQQLGREIDRIGTTTNFNGKYILSGLYADTGLYSEDERYMDNFIISDINENNEVAGAINLQVGANTMNGDVIQINFSGMNAVNLLTEMFWAHDGDYGQMGTLVPAPDGAMEQVGDSIESTTATSSETAWSINSFQSLINVIDGLHADGTAIDQKEEPQTGIGLVNELRSQLGAVQNRLEHTISNVDTIAENMQGAESRIRDVDMAKEMMAFTKNNILNQAATAMLAQANQAPQSILSLLK